MLSIQPASAPIRRKPRIGLAVAGGGPIGGMYELGALRALDEAIEGLDLTRLEVYVGVSSGAFLSASLANRMNTATMCRIFLTGDSGDVRFRPETFLRPAFFEYARRVVGLPRLLMDWWRSALMNPSEIGVGDLIGRFGGLIPNGLFDNSGIEEFLRAAFTHRGRSNDFRELKRKLRVIAVDLDSAETVRFGGPGWDDVPISVAVQASSALPGLYPPVKLHGRHLVDGALRRTMHGSVALDEDIDLLIGLNPLVPYDGHHARNSQGERLDSVTDGGLPMVLSQTFRTLLQSRMQVGLAKYAKQYAHSAQLIFEPNADDAEVFFTNAFSYSSRLRVCEHAYNATLRDLARHREVLKPLLARLGLGLRDELLDRPPHSMMDSVRRAYRPHTATTAKLARALDEVEELIETRAPAAAKRGKRKTR
ncbi:patatin-like phospholipase family protein [Aquimonas sp.]|jgi:NTE family protein|uniref:patatin-like phospholipase family protein n=1 Tax=Aquimonas sp. TaxID=1872588 RepID=UPI0037C1338A